MSPALRTAARRMALLIAALWVLALAALIVALGACGGGDATDPQPPTIDPPRCRTHPKECA